MFVCSLFEWYALVYFFEFLAILVGGALAFLLSKSLGKNPIWLKYIAFVVLLAASQIQTHQYLTDIAYIYGDKFEVELKEENSYFTNPIHGMLGFKEIADAMIETNKEMKKEIKGNYSKFLGFSDAKIAEVKNISLKFGILFVFYAVAHVFLVAILRQVKSIYNQKFFEISGILGLVSTVLIYFSFVGSLGYFLAILAFGYGVLKILD